MEEYEPFAFMAGGNTVIASAASLRFLEDIAMAYTWLDKKGYATQSVADYLLMLRYWPEDGGRPPKPWDALCIPADAFDDTSVADRARRIFDSAAGFILLHEYGHVLHRHPGNEAVPPDVSRANEEEADRFALDVFARLHELPLGVTIVFFTMANLHENRADYATDQEYQQTLAGRTHPVSPARLQSVARHLSSSAAEYQQGFQPGAEATALGVALEISTFAHLLNDRGIQAISRQIGVSVRPEDLAPRPRDRLLAPPCGSPPSSGEDFDGTLHGEIVGGSTALRRRAVLRRDGNYVVGTFTYGAGFGRMEGRVEGSTLTYDWELAFDSGKAQMTFDGYVYSGTWGLGESDSGAGSISMRREP